MKLQYCKVVQHNSGITRVITESGEASATPNEDIIVTLNKFGNQGWEVISAGPDSGGVTYLLKRERKEEGSDDALLEYYKREGD